MFSGAWLRFVAFVLIYLLLLGFTMLYAKKIERPIDTFEKESFEADPRMDRGLVCFVSILGVGIAAILSSGFIPAIQDYTMIIVAVTFLIGGIVSTLVCGMTPKELGKFSIDGVVSIFPAVIMILMASSIKFTMDEAHILDTMLHGMIGVASTLPRWSLILFIYLVMLIAEFFIPSGSAKAFMLMPIILPIAQIFDISAQLCIVAFAFGDGFSNVFYPTNPALLISLGLVDVSYGKWVKWSVKFQIANIILTCALLLLGFAVGY
jgi:uncharacterized ion transporter superfamily protein YfcC